MLELFSPDGTPWQPQQNMGVIHVPQINLKMANWFHMGLVRPSHSHRAAAPPSPFIG